MAEEIGQGYVRVRPDTTGFQREAEGRLGPALKRIAALAAAALSGREVLRFFQQTVEEARAANKVSRLTGQVIKTTGGAANVSAGHVKRLSDRIEQLTAVDGDLVAGSANLLLTFTKVRNEVGKGNQIFDRATAIVTDMSVALGQDAKNGAIQVGKALNDPIKGVTALQRVGVSFTEQQREQIKTLVESGKTLEAQKIILKELETEFGGAAAAAADPADRSAVALGRLREEIGQQLLPAVDRFHTVIADRVAPALADLVARHGPKVTAFLGRVADGLGDLPDKVGDLFQGLQTGTGVNPQVTKSFADLRDAGRDLLPALKDAAAELPSLADVLNLAGVAAGFLADHSDELAKALPFLAAGFLAVKAAQAAANAAVVVTIPLRVAELATNRALLVSQRQLTASIVTQTGAVTANTAAENTGLLTRARSLAGTVAHTAASVAARAATAAWTAAQWLLNAAITANPIGLMIVAAAALAAGIVLLWQHSETFRKIVTAAFTAVWSVIKGGWNWVKQHWPLLLAILTGPIGLATLAIVKNWDKIKSGVRSAKDYVIARLRDAVDWVRGMPGRIASAAGGMWDGITRAFKSAINTIIRGWNSIEFRVPAVHGDWNGPLPGGGFTVGGFTLGLPDVPLLQRGGIIRRRPGGVLVVVGEGPRDEVVEPLPPDWQTRGRGGGHVFNFTVYARDRPVEEVMAEKIERLAVMHGL